MVSSSSQANQPPTEKENPFHVEIKEETRRFLSAEKISLLFTTYEAGQCITIGAGHENKTVIIERRYDRPMSLLSHGCNIWLSTLNTIWKLENGLEEGQTFNKQWERLYLPRTGHVTGNVDIHDLEVDSKGDLYAVITKNNVIGRITGQRKGNFTPVWMPNFIDALVDEDRCHLNGFCYDEKGPAYVSVVGLSNEARGWEAHKGGGGAIIAARTNEVVIDGLSMPHTPRLYNGALWFLESGRGYLCRYDLQNRTLEKKLWLPGFLRGLRFFKHYAVVCSSKPRDKVFDGLPLEGELKQRGQEAQCAVMFIDLNTMEKVHQIGITGSVKEIYDVAILEDCVMPLVYGLDREDLNKMIVIGN
jgi:uncharacterized protein (TIGR03032 family)